MLEIYRSDIAMDRPRRAWEFLPLGWKVDLTLEELAETAVEAEADRAEVYRANLEFLSQRRASVERNLERWKAGVGLVEAGSW